MTGKRADKTVVKLLFTTAILLAAGTCCPGAETGCSDGMAAPSRSALTRPEDTYRKTGFSFTPIPALSYSSDLGFQLGAILDAYWFGDGSTYPKYRHKLTAEACYYTKGSGIYYLFYDSEYLIRGLRFTASASYLPNTMMAFYGFNGYPAPFLRDKNAGFYAVDRNLLRIMGDLQGPIAGHLGWAAGAAFFHYATGRTRVEKYAGETTLYDLYRRYGIIYDDESGGGSHIELRAGVVYDTRDNEPDPSCGLYADLLLDSVVHIITAVVRKSALDEVQGFDASLNTGSDYDFWLRLSRAHRIDQLDVCAAWYRIHAQSITRQPWPQNAEYTILLRTLTQHGARGADGRSVPEARLQRRLFGIAFGHGYLHFWHGQAVHARRAFAQALSHSFWHPKVWAYWALTFVRPDRQALKVG